MDNVLYIPHYPDYKLIKNRSYIIARELSGFTNVYYVHWHIPSSRNLQSKLIAQFKNLDHGIHSEGMFHIINMPLLFWPDKSTSKYAFNEWMINSIIRKLNITIVINAGTNLIRFSRIKNIIKIYDIVDDHLDENENLGIDSLRLSRLTKDIKSADLITAITEKVQNKVQIKFNSDAILVPNGIDLTKQELLMLPERNGYKNCCTFGFIGNIHEKWVNLNLALDAFKDHLKEYPEDKFEVIGGGDTSYLQRLTNEYNCAQIEFLGPIKQEKIYDYFAHIDIGVIPFHINSFTENSLPIKAIEHGCFDTPVVSTPINALKKLSYVHFGTSLSQWKTLYKKLRFDQIHIDRHQFLPYIWETIVKNFYESQICKLREKTLLKTLA